MKNSYFLIITFLLLSSSVISQPVITYDGNCPQIGDRYDLALFTGNIDPGPSGTDLSWDFSEITSDGNSILYALDPAQTPYHDFYPDANIAFNYNNEDAYSYGLSSHSELLNLGTVSIQNSIEIILYYSNPAILMAYPFHYNDTFDDTFFGSFTSGTLEVHQSGSITSLADGWGSITTPYETYSSVLRVKTESTQIDSAWMNGSFVYASTTHYTDFEWYAPDIHMPVFSINVSENSGVSDTTGRYLTTPQGISGAHKPSENMVLFPNPATDNTTVLFHANNTNAVTITVTDLSGKEMIHLVRDIPSAGTQNIRLRLESLRAGIYLVNLNDGKETYCRQLIVR